jgi:hypothetical protein
MRTRFGPIILSPRLTRGRYAELPPEEVRQLLGSFGLVQDEAPSARHGGRTAPRHQVTRFERGKKR